MSSTHVAPPAGEERPGGVFRYVSPSRLALWMRCPLAFRLKYLDGLVEPPTPSLFVGKVVHRGLEHYYRHRSLAVKLTCDEVQRYTDAVWEPMAEEEGVVFPSAAEEERFRCHALGLVTAYLATVPADEPPVLAVERVLEMPLVAPDRREMFDLPLVGIVDLILDGPEGPVIVDFKTAAARSPAVEIVHEIQFSSYAWLFRRVFDREEAALEIRSLIKTRRPQLEVHRYPPRTPGHLRRLFAAIRAYLDDLDRGRFVFRLGLACGLCDYRETHCRNWQG